MPGGAQRIDRRLIGLGMNEQLFATPIQHQQAVVYADSKTVKRVEVEGRIAFRYCDSHGKQTAGANPNGSVQSVAGVLNERGNVLGLMPHPDRCAEKILGNDDGARLFESVLSVGRFRRE